MRSDGLDGIYRSEYDCVTEPCDGDYLNSEDHR
jgi:hypothetical protein